MMSAVGSVLSFGLWFDELRLLRFKLASHFVQLHILLTVTGSAHLDPQRNDGTKLLRRFGKSR